MPTQQVFQIRVQRGPRQLRVRQLFTSSDEAVAYVREHCRERQLEVVYESTEPSEYSGTLMLLTTHESFWIEPFVEARVARMQARTPPRPPASPTLTFTDWVRHVFDRPVPEESGQAWYWHEHPAWEYSAYPATVVNYLGQLFESAPALLLGYSDGQVAQGLGYLINNSLSDYMFPLMDPDVEWPERQRAILAMYVVFERVFDPKCSPVLSHARTQADPPINPLNGECYMWWDVCPLRGRAGPSAAEDILATEELVDAGPPVDPHAADIEVAILDIMERTLALDNVACQEAALHGLGHRHHEHPTNVETIVDRYLQRQGPGWPHDEQLESLRGYAHAARLGRVQ
jgi:hypothetical protein